MIINILKNGIIIFAVILDSLAVCLIRFEDFPSFSHYSSTGVADDAI